MLPQMEWQGPLPFEPTCDPTSLGVPPHLMSSPAPSLGFSPRSGTRSTAPNTRRIEGMPCTCLNSSAPCAPQKIRAPCFNRIWQCHALAQTHWHHMLFRKSEHHAPTEISHAKHLFQEFLKAKCPQNPLLPSACSILQCYGPGASHSATDSEQPVHPQNLSTPSTRRTYQGRTEPSSFRRLNQALRRTHQAHAELITAHCSAFDKSNGASSRRTPQAPGGTYPSSAFAPGRIY